MNLEQKLIQFFQVLFLLCSHYTVSLGKEKNVRQTKQYIQRLRSCLETNSRHRASETKATEENFIMNSGKRGRYDS